MNPCEKNGNIWLFLIILATMKIDNAIKYSAEATFGWASLNLLAFVAQFVKIESIYITCLTI